MSTARSWSRCDRGPAKKRKPVLGWCPASVQTPLHMSRPVLLGEWVTVSSIASAANSSASQSSMWPSTSASLDVHRSWGGRQHRGRPGHTRQGIGCGSRSDRCSSARSSSGRTGRSAGRRAGRRRAADYWGLCWVLLPRPASTAWACPKWHFIDPAEGIRSSKDVEIKWGIHPAGDKRAEWTADDQRTTLVFHVSGDFRIDLTEGSFTLRARRRLSPLGARHRPLLGSSHRRGGRHRPLAIVCLVAAVNASARPTYLP